MSSKRLPGFLRRSLRLDYNEDEDEEDEGSSANNAEEGTTNPTFGEVRAPAIVDTVQEQATVVATSTEVDSSETRDNNATTTTPQLPPGTPAEAVAGGVDESEQTRKPTSYSQMNPNVRSKLSDSWQAIPDPMVPVTALPEEAPKLSWRDAQFQRCLTADVVSLVELRKLGWNGIPKPHRGLAWKLLLGYVPTNEQRRTQTLQRKRAEYKDAMAQHYNIDDNSRTLQEQETLRQVLVDVPRTAPEIPLFRHDRIKRVLTRLLYIWAMRHPASSYVQGINDLATPLIIVFLADYYDGQDVLDGHVMNHLGDDRLDELEADVYWCLTNLLSGIQDHYTADQPGVQRMVKRLEELVQRIDANLCQHLRNEGVQFLQFSFKWMNCLLLREFHLRCIPRLWDTYISERNGFEDFHVYVCAAFLCQFSSQLQGMAFDELFGFFQQMPTTEWSDTEIEMLLSQAYVLFTLFGGSDAHLAAGQPR